MPSKKKKGKNSKFARMSDEERARYLQHRAEIELESKLRKQQLIALFMKNKLKREEAMTRINTAKIDEKWRYILRQSKCKELKGEVKVLEERFDRNFKLKDSLIRKLYEQLLTADLDHRRFQIAHMDIIDDFVERSHKGFSFLQDIFDDSVNRIETEDLPELRMLKLEMVDSITHLKMISFTLNKCIEDTLTEMKTRYAMNIYDAQYSNDESLVKLKRDLGSKLEYLWHQLQSVISYYEDLTESKRKQYEFLKEQDDVHQAEAACFPKLYSQLKCEIDKLKRTIEILTRERKDTIMDQEEQTQISSKQIWKLRKEMKMAQTLDHLQLKRLSSYSTEAIKELEKLYFKVLEVQTIANMCIDLEPLSIESKKYIVTNLEIERKQSNNTFSFLRKLENLRNNIIYIQEENDNLKQERNTLVQENNRLRYYMRNYLATVSTVPSIRPRTRV